MNISWNRLFCSMRPPENGRPRSSRGFSLAEVLLALGFITVVVLAVMGLGIFVLKGGQKATDLSTGQLVAETELQRAIYQADNNKADPLWTNNSSTTPFRSYQSLVGKTNFQVAIYSEDLVDTASNPIGGTTSNIAKKVDALVTWWDEQPGKGRSGYGLLQVINSRVIDGP